MLPRSIYTATLQTPFVFHSPCHYNTSTTLRSDSRMSSNSLNYPLLAIPAYYVFSLVPHMYAGSILASNGYKVNNANPKASLSPDAVKGKVPDTVYVAVQYDASIQFVH
jgi:hypothetical protein